MDGTSSVVARGLTLRCGSLHVDGLGNTIFEISLQLRPGDLRGMTRKQDNNNNNHHHNGTGFTLRHPPTAAKLQRHWLSVCLFDCCLLFVDVDWLTGRF